VLISSSELQARIAQANDEMPVFVKMDPEQLLDDIQHSVVRIIPGCDAEWQPIDVMYLIAMHCGIRHTDFLLERSLVLRKQLESTRLVPSARSLLRLVLRIVMMKDYCSDFQQDLIGLVRSCLPSYTQYILTVVKACLLRRSKCWFSLTGVAEAGFIARQRSRHHPAVGDDTAIEHSHSCAGGRGTCGGQPCNMCAGKIGPAAYARPHIGASSEAIACHHY